MADEKEFPSDKADKFVLRLPEGMRDRIKAAAQKNNRSMNSEVIARLETSFLFKQGRSATETKAVVKSMEDKMNEQRVALQKIIDLLQNPE